MLELRCSISALGVVKGALQDRFGHKYLDQVVVYPFSDMNKKNTTHQLSYSRTSVMGAVSAGCIRRFVHNESTAMQNL